MRESGVVLFVYGIIPLQFLLVLFVVHEMDNDNATSSSRIV